MNRPERSSDQPSQQELAERFRAGIATGVGRGLKHESADKHVSGAALYVDDRLEFANQLHVCARLSEHAHARILHIDTSPCYAFPGVAIAITSRDVPGELDIGAVAPGDPLLADGVVQYVGQMVLAVAADDPEIARQAAQAARIDYEVLEPLLDVEEALRRGELELTPVRFRDNDHLLRIVNRIVAGVGRRIDESSPMVDARLADGSRVNAAIYPITIDGAAVSIRKFSKKPYTLEKLVDVGAMPMAVADFLHGAIRSRVSTVISGGTGSGKTTLLNALSAAISHNERLITIEDAAELQMQQPHVVRMETRPPNIEGKGEIRQRELVKNALRMRPDRVILGEVRGEEAFDMLQAMNTGHEGSMATIHANTPRDAITRLEQMVAMSGMRLTPESMRGQIASAIGMIVQVMRLSDGKRKCMSVTEITGMEGQVVQMQEIFAFHRTHTGPDGTVHGEFRATGLRPRCLDEMIRRGIPYDTANFDPSKPLG